MKSEDTVPPPVKLFVITLHKDNSTFEKAAQRLAAKFGPIDFTTDDFPFVATKYYEKEMGSGLTRRFCAFQNLISPVDLIAIKFSTMDLENDYRQQNCRTINLDPGYIDYCKVVLASTKFGGQKIYLRDGIYADMNLVMHQGKWQSFEWSFPDFKSGLYDTTLSQMRELYKEQVRALKLS